MEKRHGQERGGSLQGGGAAVLLLAGFLSGLGIKRLLPAAGEAVPVYSVEGLRDKKWSDAVSLPATVEAGSLTAWYYDSRKPVSELYVTEGQKVEAGTALLRYDCTALAGELSGVERSLANQRVYLERLGGFIGTLKATKPRPDGLGRNRGGAGGGLVLASAWTEGGLSVPGGQTAPASAEESLEGFVEAEGAKNVPVVYDRVDETSVPSGGTGTAQDPYVYYVKKGGEVAPEVLAVLVQRELCGRFVVVEGNVQAPLLVWTFDGKLYGEIVKGESPSASESASEPVSESGSEQEPSQESSAHPSEDSGESGTGEESSDSQTESGTDASEPAESMADGNGTEEPGADLPPESPSVPEESPSEPETPPDFGGDFDDDALDEALGGLETMPQGYTKEELARAIRERSLEYENLELAIRKNELQAESLRQEIEENVLTAETDGLVRTAMDPKEAARLGQPVLTVQGRSGSLLCGQMNEVLAAALQPGERLTVSARVREKEVSFEAVLQSVEREPGEGTASGGSGMPGGMSVEGDLSAGKTAGPSSGSGTENPAMSYYRFVASPAEKTGIRAGDTVAILIPRTALGQGAAAGGDTAAEGSEGSVILPDALLSYEGGSAFVYAMDGNGRLKKRPVETGRSFEGTKTEILSGITGEDYLAYPEEAAGMEGAKARIVYGEEMEIGTEESEGWEETEP